MSTLYELTGDYMKLLEMAEDPEVDLETLNDTLEGLEGEIEIKAENYAKVIKQLEGDASTIETEEKRLQAKRKAIENNIATMKNHLENAMRTTGKTKFKTDLFSFNIQKNPPSARVNEEMMDKIPLEYLVFPEPKVDKKKVLEELKNGAEFEWAEISQGESLRIR